ncbi:MAG: hypothetical protein ACK59A_02135 [Cyanobacteriota bacterium]
MFLVEVGAAIKVTSTIVHCCIFMSSPDVGFNDLKNLLIKPVLLQQVMEAQDRGQSIGMATPLLACFGMVGFVPSLLPQRD